MAASDAMVLLCMGLSPWAPEHPQDSLVAFLRVTNPGEQSESLVFTPRLGSHTSPALPCCWSHRLAVTLCGKTQQKAWIPGGMDRWGPSQRLAPTDVM